jgi:hypothetical protein
VIESLIRFCYRRNQPRYQTPQGLQISHWAELFIAADKYQIDKSAPAGSISGLGHWASYYMASSINLATERLLSHHDGTVKSPESAETQAGWKETDFDDLVRAVHIFLDSTLSNHLIEERLKGIEWSAFAVGDRRAAWVDLIEKYPSYIADLIAAQSTEEWMLGRVKAKRKRRETAAKVK